MITPKDVLDTTRKIQQDILAEEAMFSADGGVPAPAQSDIQFTGKMRYDNTTAKVWYEFTTPGSWLGKTWFTGLKGQQGYLESREPEDMD